MGENRIMPGGELDIRPENVQTPPETSPASNPQPPTSTAASQLLFTNEYTLDARIINFLEGTRNPNIREVDSNEEGVFSATNLLYPTEVKDFVAAIGADAFMLNGFTYAQSKSGGTYLFATLNLSHSIPGPALEKGLTGFLGGPEDMQYFLSTDLAQAIGLDRHDPHLAIDISNPEFEAIFPNIRQVRNLRGAYLIPADPYLLLLGVDVAQRRFLSACLDEARNVKAVPFSLSCITDKYDTKTLSSYGFRSTEVNPLVESGFITTPTIVRVGKQVGIKDLKPYVEGLAALREMLREAKVA